MRDALARGLGRPRHPPAEVRSVALDQPVDALGVVQLRQPDGQLVVQPQAETVLRCRVVVMARVPHLDLSVDHATPDGLRCGPMRSRRS